MELERVLEAEQNSKPKVRSIFISDVHLGCRFSKAANLYAFLKGQQHPQHLYIVGDFIDGWKFRRQWSWNDDCNNLIRKILKLSKHGTQIHYIVGNHDEFLREFFYKDHLENHFGSISF